MTIEPLDARILLYAPAPPELLSLGDPLAVASAPPADMETQPDGLPILNSFPEASVGVYLDFDGHGSNALYDHDGDPDDIARIAAKIATCSPSRPTELTTAAADSSHRWFLWGAWQETFLIGSHAGIPAAIRL